MRRFHVTLRFCDLWQIYEVLADDHRARQLDLLARPLEQLGKLIDVRDLPSEAEEAELEAIDKAELAAQAVRRMKERPDLYL